MPALKPSGRIAIIEQEFDDPIARQWDKPEDRITREQVRAWMADAGFELVSEFDLFQGANNPSGHRNARALVRHLSTSRYQTAAPTPQFT